MEPTNPPASPFGQPPVPPTPPAPPEQPAAVPPPPPTPEPSQPDIAPPGISQTLPPDAGKPSPPPPFGVPPAVTVGDGGVPTPASGQVFTASDPISPSASGGRFPKKLLVPIIVASAALVLFGGAAAFYFGYYMNPSVIYSQSLKDTGKGYDKLVDYADRQSKLDIKGYTGSGSYQIKSPSFSADGKLAFKSSNDKSDTAFDIGANGIRVNTDIRTIRNGNATPDIYLKADGIKSLGTMVGMPTLDPELAKLDSNWIVIDHTLIDSLNARSGQTDTSPPNRDQIIDEARAFGKVNQQYLFSTAKDKAVTQVVKKYGRETVDGHGTYHYQIALRKDNVKKYVLAQRDALKASKLNDWLKKNNYDESVYNSLTDTANSSRYIKSSDTYDIWMDTGQRVVYKVRFNYQPNPADNYVDVGLNYKGGDDYPFFISGKSKDSAGASTTTFSFIADVNTKTNNTDFKFDLKTDGSDAGTFTADFGFKPSASAVKIDKPEGAIPLTQVLSDLGLGGLLGAQGATANAGAPATVQLGNKLNGIGTGGSSAEALRDSPLRQLLKP